MGNKNEAISYINSISTVLLGLLLFAFPLFVLTITTDAFILPKQILLGGVVFLIFILLGIKLIIEGFLKIRRTPFDGPVLLFAAVALLSALLSVNRIDSLTVFVPLLLGVLSYFAIVNVAKEKSSLMFIISSFATGSLAVSVLSTLAFFKIYPLPYSFTHIESFTSFGSLLDQSIYLAIALLVCGYFAMPIIDKPSGIKAKNIAFGIVSLCLLLALFVSIYQLFTPSAGSGQKPIILPLQTGFQTAFASISQDASRIAQGFFLGSGFGTYATDFTRFKQAIFNQSSDLWNLTFLRSSSFVLELLATTGVLGFLAYLYLGLKGFKEAIASKKDQGNAAAAALIILLIVSLILPFSFISQTLIFILLGLLAAGQGLKTEEALRFFDVEFQLVEFKKGLIAVETDERKYKTNRILPVSFFVLILAIVGVVGFASFQYVLSDIRFQSSLVFASANNGLETYKAQADAIAVFPYRDSFYRVFSQTNLALANAFVAQQPKGSSPSAQTQQTVTTLIQQGINAGRNATTNSPLTSVNWQNLSSIYRSLIGFGQNAENFAIATQQQAALLDPNNPQEYINLGGIYYQLGQYDNAQNQFQIAVNLKPDYANAYYNLGHALESKNDFTNALTQYQTVKNLVSNDKNSLDLVNKDIDNLNKKMQSESIGNQANGQAGHSSSELNLSTPQASLPPQNPQIQIPAPSVSSEAGK